VEAVASFMITRWGAEECMDSRDLSITNQSLGLREDVVEGVVELCLVEGVLEGAGVAVQEQKVQVDVQVRF
jgi:hypothetical protein